MKTLAEYDRFMDSLRDGGETADGVRMQFESILYHQEEFQADLGKLTKAQLQRFTMRPVSTEKKAALVRMAWHSVLQGFSPDGVVSYDPMSKDGFVNAVRDSLAGWSDEWIQQAAEKRRAREAEAAKAERNPETLDELVHFARKFGMNELPVEKRIELDALMARSTRERRAERLDAEYKERIARHQRILGEVRFSEVIETTHTQKGHAVFVVQLEERVERNIYDGLNERAKTLGGYYSSYSRGGAVPGFQFKTRDDAEAFRSTVPEAAATRASERKAVREDEAAACRPVRLLELAERTEAQADEILAGDRKVNTSRRADIAARMANRARDLKATASTLRKLGEAQERGEIEFLDRLWQGVQLGELMSLLREARWERIRAESWDYKQREAGQPYDEADVWLIGRPSDTFSRTAVEVLASELTGKSKGASSVKGIKKTAATVRKLLEKNGDSQIVVHWDLLAEAKSKLKELPWQFHHSWNRRSRLERMNLVTSHEIRSAVRELLRYHSAPDDEPKLDKMIRALIGTNIPGFFPTPPLLAARVIAEAQIEEGMTVLEPSAGKGDLLDALPEGVETLVYEVHTGLAEILKEKGHPVQCSDFLNVRAEACVDRVVMNPPFESGLDVTHVKHAYGFLKPGGRLVAIMGAGVKYRSTGEAPRFREFVEERGRMEDLPEGAFMAGFRATGVNTVLVTLEKPLYQCRSCGQVLAIQICPDCAAEASEREYHQSLQ